MDTFSFAIIDFTRSRVRTRRRLNRRRSPIVERRRGPSRRVVSSNFPIGKLGSGHKCVRRSFAGDRVVARERWNIYTVIVAIARNHSLASQKLELYRARRGDFYPRAIYTTTPIISVYAERNYEAARRKLGSRSSLVVGKRSTPGARDGRSQRAKIYY